MSSQRDSSGSTFVEMTLAEFASRWPHALRLYRRASAAAGSIDALPERVRLAIEKCAETEADQLIKGWDERRRRQVLELRELDLFPSNAQTFLRRQALETVRTELGAKVQARYRALARRTMRFFGMRLAEASSRGATIKARHNNGTQQALTRSELLDENLAMDGNTILSKRQQWFSVSVSLPRGHAAPPSQEAASQPILTLRKAGAKPTKREAAIAHLREAYPKGIPPSVKNDALVGELAAADIHVSEKTVRRALKEMGQNPAK